MKAYYSFWPLQVGFSTQSAYETTGMDVLMVAKGYETGIGWDDSNFRLCGLEAN